MLHVDQILLLSMSWNRLCSGKDKFPPRVREVSAFLRMFGKMATLIYTIFRPFFFTGLRTQLQGPTAIIPSRDHARPRVDVETVPLQN